MGKGRGRKGPGRRTGIGEDGKGKGKKEEGRGGKGKKGGKERGERMIGTRGGGKEKTGWEGQEGKVRGGSVIGEGGEGREGEDRRAEKGKGRERRKISSAQLFLGACRVYLVEVRSRRWNAPSLSETAHDCSSLLLS